MPLSLYTKLLFKIEDWVDGNELWESKRKWEIYFQVRQVEYKIRRIFLSILFHIQYYYLFLFWWKYSCWKCADKKKCIFRYNWNNYKGTRSNCLEAYNK